MRRPSLTDKLSDEGDHTTRQYHQQQSVPGVEYLSGEAMNDDRKGGDGGQVKRNVTKDGGDKVREDTVAIVVVLSAKHIHLVRESDHHLEHRGEHGHQGEDKDDRHVLLGMDALLFKILHQLR